MKINMDIRGLNGKSGGDDETGLLLKAQTYEDDERAMTIEWRNIKINTGIQDSDFEIPEGVNVVGRDAQNK